VKNLIFAGGLDAGDEHVRMRKGKRPQGRSTMGEVRKAHPAMQATSDE